MTKTLYDRLKGVEKLNEDVEDGYKIHIPALQMLQKELFLRYSEYNKILSEVMIGEKSLEKTVDELAAEFKGHRRFIPYRKNEEHNKKVDELTQIIPINGLRKNGLFSPDNFITNFSIMAAFGLAFYAVPDLFKTIQPQLGLEEFKPIKYMSYGIFLFLAPFCGFVGSTNRKEAIKESKKAAHYIDDKIKELFP